MDKDLAAAILLERCQCYNKSLASAKKVLEKSDANLDETLWARRIIKSLGEVFVSQRFMDKAMECYQLLLKYPPPEPDDATFPIDVCPEPEAGPSPFADLGPNTVTLTTSVNQDVYDILEALKRVEGNENKDDAELIREGIYQLFLKYAEDKGTRELIFDKIRHIVD
jgi:tetratricopeptide (TPR) repeat protein